MVKIINILLVLQGVFLYVQSEDRLIAVNLLYRHGDRTPLKFYPNDIYQDPSYWPTGLGDLTNIGKEQHYELGKWFRERYNDSLSPVYDQDEIYIRSSNNDRCLMSAESNLAGLYPPVGKDVWLDNMPWQPIPVHTVPEEYDDIAEAQISCAIYDTLKDQAEELPYFKNLKLKYQYVYDILTENTGMEFYRHGDRTPVDFYPNDPNNKEVLWSAPFGDLTNIGKQQHYKLGQWFRKRYNNFLSENFDKNEIYVRSSDDDRCIMSAESNLAGLYPPKGNDVWSKDITWQPIPIHTTPKKFDDVIEVLQSCKNYEGMMIQVLESPYFQNINKENQKFYAYLSKNTGWDIQNLYHIIDLYDIIYIEKMNNLTIPKWVDDETYGKLEKLYMEGLKIFTFNVDVARLFNGRYYDIILEQFTNALNSKKFNKLSMFSGHDYQIYSILNNFDITVKEHVPYAAAVIFELTKSNEVNITYEFNENTYTKKLTFDEFKEKIAKLTITSEEFDMECNN